MGGKRRKDRARRYGQVNGNIPYSSMTPEQVEEARKKKYQQITALPDFGSAYADSAKRIYKYRYLVFTKRQEGEAIPLPGTHTEVIIFANKSEEALEIGKRHFKSDDVHVIDAGDIWVDEKGSQHIRATPETDMQLHVDQGVRHCTCCLNTSPPHAWIKKGAK